MKSEDSSDRVVVAPLTGLAPLAGQNISANTRTAAGKVPAVPGKHPHVNLTHQEYHLGRQAR